MKPAMFRLKRPCENCPFLKEGAIELRPGRLQGIIDGLVNDDMSNFRVFVKVGIEIPECRRFFKKITKQWPFWFHFVVKEPMQFALVFTLLLSSDN